MSILLFLLCISLNVFAQQEKITVSGTVTDEKNEAIVGANVFVKDNAGLGVNTNADGKYTIQVKKNATLVFSYLGYDKQEIDINGRSTIDVKMAPSENNVLNEVVVTGSGVQKKASVTGAITTVDVATLKVPTSNITNALAGNVAGIISMQVSGEPGSNHSEFWIRGISTFGANTGALVLVDGFERPFNEINIEDIESFSVLKDASATAIYGSRGANGVILVTTKRGKSGKISIDGKVEYGYNTRTRTPEFVDGLTYAKLINEARTTRNLEPFYNNNELGIIENNLDPDLYPNVNWKDVLLKDGASTYRATLNVNGGGELARFYISGSYVNEGGMYKTDRSLKDYNTNSNMSRYNYRMNADMDITSSTKLSAGISGFLEKQNHPGLAQNYYTVYYTNLNAYSTYLSMVNGEGVNIWKSIVGYSPLATPIQYSNGLTPAYGTGEYTNPWVLATQTGYQEYWESKVETNVSIDQNFDFITKGLSFTGRFAFDSDNKNSIDRVQWPEQYNTQRRRDANGNLVFYRVSPQQLMTQSSSAWGQRVYDLEADLKYDRVFNKVHSFSVFLKYAQREQTETSNPNDKYWSIPRRDQSYSGRASYNFKNRYFVEFNGGYTGSEVFKFGHQFGFFPAISGGWNISEEPVVKNITSIFDLLKIRYSYGQVGNNRIMQGNNEIRFPYVGTIRTNIGGYNYGDLNSPNYSGLSTQGNLALYPGITDAVLAANYLTWEVAAKHDLGLDFNLWKSKFSGVIDIFKETRSDIYMQRTHLPQMTGITSQPWANIGKMENRGFDGQFNVTKKINDVTMTMRGNITYSRNKVLEYDEGANTLPYEMTQGYRWDQAKGLIALGLFKDYDDIRNSPTQTYGAYMPGDIKYKDINGDGKIDDNDIVAIGATRVPSLVYGVGVSALWKGFDVNVHFQGSGKSSYFINGPAVYPFSEFASWNTLPWGNVLTDMVGNYWSTNNTDEQNANAKYPRLSYGGYGGTANNYRASSWWLRNGAYLRFKTFEFGYTLPKKTINKLHINNVRIYFVGSNLFLWDSLKLWDPELGSNNGMDYPPTKTFTGGLTITL
jgi:TonB-linked SusC/RagA family outer membrane protein